MYRLKMIGILFMLAMPTAGCGGGAGPLGLLGPPSANDIADRPLHSGMRDGHFSVRALLVNGATRMSGSGDGVMLLQPIFAFRMNLQVDTGTFIGRIGFDLIETRGKKYTRIGNEDWQASDDPATSNSPKSFKYIGSEQIANNEMWHIQSHVESWTYDEWVRQSDGYLAKFSSLNNDDTTLTLAFDRYNVGATVQPPPPADPKKAAAKAYQNLVDPLNQNVNTINSSAGLHESAQDLAGYKTDMADLAKLEGQYVAGLKNIQFPPTMEGDVRAVTDAEAQYIQLTERRSQAPSWAAVTATNNSWNAASKARMGAINKLRDDLGLSKAPGS